MAFQFTDQNFESEVLNAKGVALVDFFAEWCPPCKQVAPIIKELAAEFEGKAKIGKLDVDANPETASKFGVRSIPTIILFKDGENMETQVGVLPKQSLKELIERYL